MKGALEELNKAIQIDKDYLPAIGNRALVNFDLKDFDNSLRDSKHYLKTFPRSDQINYVVGAIYYSNKDYNAALPHLDECKASIGTKEVFIMSGMTHYYLVHDQKAVDDFTIALEFELARSQQADLHYLIGICLNNMNPGSGCSEISKAIQFGHSDAARNYKEECK